jgi:hypothetical protein
MVSFLGFFVIPFPRWQAAQLTEISRESCEIFLRKTEFRCAGKNAHQNVRVNNKVHSNALFY